jgi:molybdate transport system ATP-binding protein
VVPGAGPHGGLAARVALVARGLDVEVAVSPGEVLAVLGPNGSGKSTLLSLVAGLARPDAGRISLDGEVLVDTAAHRWVPPHRRAVALLAQEALLFPHLSAVANVAFAPRSRGEDRRAARAEALRWLDAVDAGALAGRRPAQLSGGQAQRVAVARALAARPRLLLLDEPMAALDVGAAPALRQVLRGVLRAGERSALLVTHDVLDVLTLADRVVVLDAGRVVESGPAREVLARPRSAFAARIAGIDLLAGTATAEGLVTATGTRVTGMRSPDCAPGDPAVAVFSPSAVAVHREPPTGSPRNALRVRVAALEPRGELVRVRAADSGEGGGGLVADVTAAAAADLDLVPGLVVHFAVKATEVAVHAARP